MSCQWTAGQMDICRYVS